MNNTIGYILIKLSRCNLLLVVYVALLDIVGFTIMSTLFVLGLSYILLPKEKRTPKTCVAVFAVALAFSVALTSFS